VVAAAWIISWLIGIGISLAVKAKYPRVPGISQKAEQDRILAIAMGFVPFLGLALIVQLIELALYRARLARFLQGQASAQALLSSEDFESGQATHRGRPERPVVPTPFDEVPGNPLEQAPPSKAFGGAPASNPFE
jgi:hypothetical protein